MKSSIMTFLLATMAVQAVAAPVVSNVSMTQVPNTCLVTVKYQLSGDPGVITLDIQTNYVENAETKWASIGPENMLGFGGDVHQVVQPTTGDEYRTIYWHPETYWPGPPKTAGTARAVVTAWATNAPPDYMIVHLVSPYDVTYYPHVEMVPGGITNIKYKGEYMPMRKIPAKGVVWMAGMPTNHPCYNAASKPHRVMLNNDYYMAVYELTYAQRNAIESGAPTAIRLPRNGAAYTVYRGSVNGMNWPSFDGQGNLDWNTSHAVDSNTVIGKARTKIGLEFDVPTEHQWEYACRAGSPGTIYTETLPGLTGPSAADLMNIARFANNKKAPDCEELENDNATVGSYTPNAWGLYDMLGNVQEMCLDWYESWESLYPDDTKVYVDPVGPSRGENTQVVYRGYHRDNTSGNGQWAVTCGGRVSMSRPYDNTNYADSGIRLCVTLR